MNSFRSRSHSAYRSRSFRSPSTPSRSVPRGCVFGLIAAVTALLLLTAVCTSYQKQEVRSAVTVCNKESIATESGHEYRIYTDQGTFVIADSLIGKVRFSSADAYGRLKTGVTYRMVTKGWRLPVLSAFPNILEYTALPEAQQTPERCS